jgi:hypothetical protein
MRWKAAAQLETKRPAGQTRAKLKFDGKRTFLRNAGADTEPRIVSYPAEGLPAELCERRSAISDGDRSGRDVRGDPRSVLEAH